VTAEGAATVRRPGAAAPTAAQGRIIAAALELFARHGVGGTSLGMIATEVGVTKAAIFHQFRTRDDIILAAAEAELGHLEAVLDAADAQPTAAQAREVLITGIVDLTVERRRTVSVILSDPVIVGFFTDHEPFRRIMHRLSRLLGGDDAGPEAHVPTAMFSAAISGAVMHPLVADLDDDTLRAQLLLLTRRLFDLPDLPGPPAHRRRRRS
jgi:AcrR family transcriptional regulator